MADDANGAAAPVNGDATPAAEAPSGMLKRRSRSVSPSRSPSKPREKSRSRSRSHRRKDRRKSRSRSRSRHRRRKSRHSRSRSRSRDRRRHRSRRDDRHRRRRHSRSRSPSVGYGYSRQARRGNDRYDYRRYDRRGEPRGSRKAARADRSPSSESARLHAHTRDARTIFVSQLVRRATERDIKKYFEQVGKVRRVELITDRGGNSKGIAYVEFKKLESVGPACLLNGQQFCTKHEACTCSGFPILVKMSEADKNHVYRAQKEAVERGELAAGGVVPDGEIAKPVRPLPNNTPHPLMGMVKGMNPLSNPLGMAGVPGAAMMGMPAMMPGMAPGMAPGAAPLSGVTFPGGVAAAGGGSAIPSSWRVHVGNLAMGTTEADLRAVFSAFGDVASTSVRFDAGRTSGYGFVHFRGADAAQLAISKGNGINLRGSAITVNTVNEPRDNQDWKLDDEPMGGVSLNSTQRAELMQRLATKADPKAAQAAQAAAAAAAAAPVVSAGPAIIGDPSRCLIVRNMFNPAEETEEHWDRDIEDDVADESKKYGELVHIFVDKHSAGHVYMMFKETEQGQKAVTDLHGRYFARRRLSCEYIPSSKYLQKFPDAEKSK